MQLPHRFDIVRPWLAARWRGEKTDVSAIEFARYLVRPNKRQRAARYIRAIERDGDHWRILFHNLPDALYWPVNFELNWLYDFIDEQFNPQNWHQYEIEGTQIDRNDVVFDCGAAEGLFSLRVARRCQKVIAFEPLPDFQSALMRTLSGFSNVTIAPFAVGRDRKTVRFHPAGGASLTADGGELEVEQIALDSFVQEHGERIDFLKVDIEGAEMGMLEGARQTLIRDRPKIAMTTYHLRHDSQRFKEFLHSLNVGYQTKTKGVNSLGEPVMLHAWVNFR